MSPVISHPRSAAARHQSDELSPITITVDCPAKTNLTLEVGPAHDEWGGRHELDTIYCAIGVYDTVTATAKQPGAGFSLELEGAYLGDLASSRSDMRRNHAVLALFAMAQAAEREPDVALTITKRIPVGAGLGGGQSSLGAELAHRAPAHHCCHVGRGHAVLPDRWPCIRHRFRRTHHGYRPRQPR